jgi:hypothetical protein
MIPALIGWGKSIPYFASSKERLAVNSIEPNLTATKTEH